MRATASSNFILPFVKKVQLASDTFSFYFDRTKRNFDFLPGQYIKMALDIKNPDDRGNSRFFTISSSPLEKDYIVITTKIIKSSFKKRLARLSSLEKVKFYGPIGGFVLNEKTKEDLVFLAGGIGVTPFHSMITYASSKKLTIPITLFVSFSKTEEAVFYKELGEVASKNSNIKIVYTISQPQTAWSNWDGETGRISMDLIRKYRRDILNPLYYIAGPAKMVSAMEEMIRDMGVGDGHIFIENFPGY